MKFWVCNDNPLTPRDYLLEHVLCDRIASSPEGAKHTLYEVHRGTVSSDTLRRYEQPYPIKLERVP